MDISNILTNVVKQTKAHSPELLTGLGIAGVVSTSYLAAKAAFKASDVIRRDEAIGGVAEDRKERFKERFKLTWKLYIPPTVTGVTTVACIAGASRVSGQKAAAAVTAFTVTEKAFSEYKEKVVEQIGKGKDNKLRAAIVQDQVTANPPSGATVLAVGTKHVLCCETYTGRYFRSDMETLKKAQNQINQALFGEIYVTLSEFYDLIGLPHTSQSDWAGWEAGRDMELSFHAVMSDGDEPCMAFDYSYIKPL